MSRGGSKHPELRAALDRMLRKVSAQSVLLSQAVADRLGMNPTDLEALDLLHLHGHLPAGRLAEQTGLTTGAITGVVDRLERAGYARREADSTDRRRVIVRAVADQAQRDIAPLYAAMAREMGELFSRYTDEELGVILDFLTRSHEVGAAQIARLRAEAEARKRGPAAAGGHGRS